MAHSKNPSIKLELTLSNGTVGYRVVQAVNTLVPHVGEVLTKRDVKELLSLSVVDITILPEKKKGGE